jgi:hypothetical protein
MLRRYWFEFDADAGELPPGPGYGCGVTAHDRADAERLLRQVVFNEAAVPPTRKVVEDVDVSALDAGHVLPNMDAPTSRGVWFPRGYA